MSLLLLASGAARRTAAIALRSADSSSADIASDAEMQRQPPEARQAPEFTPLVRVSDVVKEAGRRRDLEDKRLQDWITVQLARLGFVRAPLPPGAARRA